jgi:hypothetical protein
MNSGKFTCPQCAKPFKSPRALKAHRRFCSKRDNPAPVIVDREAIAKRRERVANLRLRGTGLSAIAAELKVAISTVSEDLQAIRAENVERIRAENILGRMATEATKLERMEDRALAACFAQDPKANPKAWATVQSAWLETLRAKTRLLQDFGLLPRKAEQLKILLASEVDYSRMSRQELTDHLEKNRELLEDIRQKRQALLDEAAGITRPKPPSD